MHGHRWIGYLITSVRRALYEQVTASSRVKIDVDGTSAMATPCRAGSVPGACIRSASHMARRDLHCVLHDIARFAGQVELSACRTYGRPNRQLEMLANQERPHRHRQPDARLIT